MDSTYSKENFICVVTFGNFFNITTTRKTGKKQLFILVTNGRLKNCVRNTNRENTATQLCILYYKLSNRGTNNSTLSSSVPTAFVSSNEYRTRRSQIVSIDNGAPFSVQFSRENTEKKMMKITLFARNGSVCPSKSFRYRGSRPHVFYRRKHRYRFEKETLPKHFHRKLF